MNHSADSRRCAGRVALVVPSFPKLSESFIVSKFLGLLELGWDARVVCGASDPAQWRNFPDLERHPEARKRVQVNWPHRPRWRAALLAPWGVFWCSCRNPTGTARYLWRGARRLRAGVLRGLYLDASIVALKPEVVHFEFGALAVGRMHLRELLGCKVIVSFRGYDLNFSGLEAAGYFDEVWSHADAVHLLGADLWRRALRRGCPSAKPRALIPPAIDTKFFRPAGRAGSENDGSAGRPIRILSVGRMEWKKGYEYALQAVHLLLEMGVHCEYRIIGSGSYLEPLAFGCHQMGVRDKVRCLGALSRLEVREQMSQADIMLHAAVSEGFCNAVLEAQAMRLPVVCSDADGLSENVADGTTGFVVARRDARALADKLAVLAHDPALRERMGQAGRQRVVGRFQLADQIDAFDRLYRSVLAGEPSSRTAGVEGAPEPAVSGPRL